MTARLHAGALVHVWDHFVIGLYDGHGLDGSLSLYAIALSPGLGGGHVALLDRRGLARRVLADPVALGERMQDRLRAMGPPGSDASVEVEPAAFERHAATDEGMGWTVRGTATRVEALWASLEAPFWVEGPAPAFRDDEDIWACFVAARDATIVVDGERLPGAPADDPVWLPKLGRSLSSAHVALAEVRVTPVTDGRRGDGR